MIKFVKTKKNIMATPDSNARFLAIDSSQVDLTEKKSTSQNGKTEYHTPAEMADAAGSLAGYTYTEVEVSSAEILALQSSPKSLLPVAGAGKYYDISQVILEYTHIATAYTTTAKDMLTVTDSNSYRESLIDAVLLEETENIAVIIDLKDNINFYNQATTTYFASKNTSGYTVLNNDLILGYDGTNPTLGDGTLLVKIWYKIKTFGTEL